MEAMGPTRTGGGSGGVLLACTPYVQMDGLVEQWQQVGIDGDGRWLGREDGARRFMYGSTGTTQTRRTVVGRAWFYFDGGRRGHEYPHCLLDAARIRFRGRRVRGKQASLAPGIEEAGSVPQGPPTTARSIVILSTWQLGSIARAVQLGACVVRAVRAARQCERDGCFVFIPRPSHISVNVWSV
jgi:hypothetical protein